MRPVFATAAAILVALPAYAAGNGSVEGTIVDQRTNQVVASGVTVSIACGAVHRSATIDSAGHFKIADLPEGACTLTTNSAGFAPASIAVTVAGGSIATVLVPLMSKEYADELAKQQDMSRKRAKAADRRPAMAELDVEAPMADAAPMAAPMPMGPKHKVVTKPVPTRAAALAPPPAAPPPPPRQVGAGGAAPVVVGGLKAERVRNFEQKRPMPRMHVANGVARNEPMQQVNAWAPVRVFPVPQYTKAYDGPRTDFRETVYWNPTVETDANGDADVAFVASDAVTSFRATAEGFSAAGTAGNGETTFQAKLPLSLDAHLPVEVTSGDSIRLPITLANETDEPLDATLTSSFGAAFKLGDAPGGKIHLAAKEKKSVFFPLEVVATDGSADVDVKLTSHGLTDELHKTIRVVPRGFPIELAASGTAHGGKPVRHTLDLAGALPGSIHATVTMYPSPVAAMSQGMEAMIREPGGCFEQTSATNYPNIMILGYMESTKSADSALIQKTQGVLEHGYKLLTGYETPEKGYEWFGHTPGHEALTAYGLMEFADMAKVYDVDHKMVERTADWLMTRRDHQGGFQRSSEAIDSFGRASQTTTNAYIMWALSEAKRTAALGTELAAQKTLGGQTTDPYLLALAANTNLLAAPRAAETSAMIKHLAAMQGKDGSFTGAKETITMSGGDALAIETTSLAVLAMIKASPHSEYEAQIRTGVDWLNTKRSGYGAWGNTQATILGLKALTAYSEYSRQMAAGGTATLIINGKPAGTIKFEKGRRDALVWDDLASKLAPGKNTVELQLDGQAVLPYSVAIEYRSAQPASSPTTKVAVSTQLLATHAKLGEGVKLRAHVENKTNQGVPMTLARIGLPGGMVFQTWQLKELRDKHIIDFYETRPREVIVYWGSLAPSAKKDVDLDLLAAVPGTYEAPASSAYLYYTAEDKAWTKPVGITIDR